MIYHSNLTGPDLSEHFKLLLKPRPWSLGHDIPSDPDYEPDNCFISHDEAAILWNCARAAPGLWVDIGCRFGWTSAHIASAGVQVAAIDQALIVEQLYNRFDSNMHYFWPRLITVIEAPAAEGLALLASTDKLFSGFCIDGNHDSPEPVNDARGCLKIAAQDCCMVFHDFRGRPIRDAVRYLMNQGFKSRVYWTPAMMAVCWRGYFVPPVHVRDPKIDWAMVRRAAEIDKDFDLKACS
jgi:hypothetical protein